MEVVEVVEVGGGGGGGGGGGSGGTAEGYGAGYSMAMGMDRAGAAAEVGCVILKVKFIKYGAVADVFRLERQGGDSSVRGAW